MLLMAINWAICLAAADCAGSAVGQTTQVSPLRQGTAGPALGPSGLHILLCGDALSMSGSGSHHLCCVHPAPYVLTLMHCSFADAQHRLVSPHLGPCAARLDSLLPLVAPQAASLHSAPGSALCTQSVRCTVLPGGGFNRCWSV